VRHLFLPGATGRLGRTVIAYFGDPWVIHPCSRSGGDDLRSACPEELFPESADFALNCAALSSRGGCASDPFSAYAVNARWPARLARFCRENGRRLVHISTDLVYSGGIPPYTESSPAVPGSFYGWTKLIGDRAVLGIDPSACVVRTSVLVGKTGAGTPTFTEDILSGRATQFHVDCFRNHTDINSLAEYLKGCLFSSLSGLVLAAAPYSTSRAAYAFSILQKDMEMIPAPADIPRDLTLRPQVRLADSSLLGYEIHQQSSGPEKDAT